MFRAGAGYDGRNLLSMTPAAVDVNSSIIASSSSWTSSSAPSRSAEVYER